MTKNISNMNYGEHKPIGQNKTASLSEDDIHNELIKTLEFVLDDLNTDLDYETGLIIRSVLAKAKGE